jgi:hypothetical protein
VGLSMLKKSHKYGAKPTVVDGIRFASMKEAKRYQELKLLVRAGEIESLELQPVFSLTVPAATVNCGVYQPVRLGDYRGDFSYWDIRKQASVVEDVKGFKTPLYRWKKKHVEAQYGIEIREV